MWSGMLRELRYLLTHKWDLCLVTLAPLCMIVLFSSMFYQGKPEHLPIAIIDQDQSELSRNIEKYVSHNATLDIVAVSQSPDEVKSCSIKPKSGVIFLFLPVRNSDWFKPKMPKLVLYLTKAILVSGIAFPLRCCSVP